MYTTEERQVASDFLKLGIPDSIRLNKISCRYDTMEYYEALFDCAHCIISNVSCDSAFIYSISDDSFVMAISAMQDNS